MDAKPPDNTLTDRNLSTLDSNEVAKKNQETAEAGKFI